MSDFGSSKRARGGGGGSGGDKDGGGVERTSASSSSATDVLSQELKISILEQRLHEIQALKFDSIFGDRKEITAPTKLYVDPLLNLEVGVLRQRVEVLSRKLNSAGIGLDDDSNSNSSSSSNNRSELEDVKEENLVLKRKLASLSSENQIKQIEFKDNLIRELVNKVNDAKSWMKELEQENVYLSSQLLLYQQHIVTLTTSASETTDVASVLIAQAESK